MTEVLTTNFSLLTSYFMPELLSQYLIFIVLNLMLFATANTLIWRFFESEIRDPFDWFILFFIFTASEILLILSVVGFLGHLNLVWMSGGVVLIFLLGAFRWAFREDPSL